MKKIVITGACGFIGSNISEYYLKKGFKVFGIDNLMTGALKNVEDFINDENFVLIQHDVRKKIYIKENIDYILHFASPASPSDYLKFPIETLEIGSIGSKNILDFAVEKRARILLASTSEIYGDPQEHPQSESYYGNVNPIGPRGVYDEAKRYLEALAIAYKNRMNIDVKIVRIFNTYGPKMRKNDGRAIPNFINQALNNDDFTVYGNGLQTRSFCYIDDTINGINKLLFSDFNFPINIGNDTEHTIMELLEIVKSIIKTESNIIYCDLPVNDPKVRRPDISLALKILNWKPVTKLEHGLVKTISYFSGL